jgi:hypothetical protein
VLPVTERFHVFLRLLCSRLASVGPCGRGLLLESLLLSTRPVHRCALPRAAHRAPRVGPVQLQPADRGPVRRGGGQDRARGRVQDPPQARRAGAQGAVAARRDGRHARR